eukprot:4868758-Amphidinium_carterae.1
MVNQRPQSSSYQVTGSYTASSSGALEAPPPLATIVVPGQARARGDDENDEPHPGSLLQSWCVTALASLGRRRKRVQEQQAQEQVTRVKVLKQTWIGGLHVILMRLFQPQLWYQKLHHHYPFRRRMIGLRHRQVQETEKHSVLLPKIGGVTQDNPNGSGLYMIPVLSAVRGQNGCTQWASEKIKSAYQTVVRNALLLPKSDWPRVSNMRWGSRDDERFVPPKNVPPSPVDMPEQDQLAMFE